MKKEYAQGPGKGCRAGNTINAIKYDAIKYAQYNQRHLKEPRSSLRCRYRFSLISVVIGFEGALHINADIVGLFF